MLAIRLLIAVPFFAMAISRHRVVWAGSPVVGTAVSTFYTGSSTPSGVTAALATFFTGIKNTCPSGISWTVLSAYDVINQANGDLVSSGVDGTDQTVTSGTVGNNFSNGVGYRIVWNTGGIFHNRRVKGSTFIVPMVIDYYEGSGNISSVALTAAQNAANTLLAGGHSFVVWSQGAGDGQSSTILGATVPDKVSWLRSRRT